MDGSVCSAPARGSRWSARGESERERERANVVVREGTSDLRGRFCCEMQERNER